MRVARRRAKRIRNVSVSIVVLCAAIVVVAVLAFKSGDPRKAESDPSSIPARPVTSAPPEDAAVEENMRPKSVAELAKGAGIVRVYVTDGVGRFVPEAIIRLETPESVAGVEGSHALEQLANASGEGQFTELPWGRYWVGVGHEGESGGAAVHVSSRSPLIDVEIVLKPAGVITGWVLGDSAAPVAGARIELLSVRRDTALLGSSLSGDDGAFVFERVPVGQYRIQVSAGGYAPALSEVLAVDGPPITVVLNSGANLSGLVRHAASRTPMPGIPFRLVAEQFRNVAFTVVSDDRGEFQIERMPAGLVLIRSDAVQRAMAPPEVSVTLTAGRTTEVELLVEDAASITGRVLDETTGAPIPGVTIRATDPTYHARYWYSAPADGDGRYVLAGLTPGSLEVSIDHAPPPYTYGAKSGDRKRIVTLQPGEAMEGVDIALDTGLMVCGDVVDARDQPVPGATVSLGRTDPGDGQFIEFRTSETDVSGAFCFGNIWTGAKSSAGRLGEPQDLVLEAKSRGARSEPVTLPSVSESVVGLRLKLRPRPGGIIAGVVVDASGHPALAAISLRHPYIDNSFDTGLSHTDADGRFLFQDLSAGDFEIWLAPEGANGYTTGKQLAHALSLTDGQRATDLRLVVGTGGVISGTLLDPDRKPMRDVNIEAWDMGIGDIAGDNFTDRDGRFSIGNLEGTDFELRPRQDAPGGYWSISARPGDDVEIVLTPELLREKQPPAPGYVADPVWGLVWADSERLDPSSGEDVETAP